MTNQQETVRDEFASAMYCLAYHQLTPSQQLLVNAATASAEARYRNVLEAIQAKLQLAITYADDGAPLAARLRIEEALALAAPLLGR